MLRYSIKCEKNSSFVFATTVISCDIHWSWFTRTQENHWGKRNFKFWSNSFYLRHFIPNPWQVNILPKNIQNLSLGRYSKGKRKQNDLGLGVINQSAGFNQQQSQLLRHSQEERGFLPRHHRSRRYSVIIFMWQKNQGTATICLKSWCPPNSHTGTYSLPAYNWTARKWFLNRLNQSWTAGKQMGSHMTDASFNVCHWGFCEEEADWVGEPNSLFFLFGLPLLLDIWSLSGDLGPDAWSLPNKPGPHFATLLSIVSTRRNHSTGYNFKRKQWPQCKHLLWGSQQRWLL